MSRALVEVSVTVPSGASAVSEAIDLRSHTIVAIKTPSNWVTSNILFQISDTVSFTNLYQLVDPAGAVKTLTGIAAFSAVAILNTFLPNIGSYLRIQSVTTQTAPKIVILVLEPKSI